MIVLRNYQQHSIDKLYAWWLSHPGAKHTPLVVLPTAAGKSVVIAELSRLMFDQWPEEHPRTIVLVPSKELAEQNAQKLRALLPENISVGYYSASLGKREPDADVIVATIGSIYKSAHNLGDIKCVMIDEAHLVNPDGEEAGRFRRFLADLAKYCKYRVAGFTATPFRGNGVWLTAGDAPLFTGVAHTVTIQELLALNFLSPLVRPVDVIATRIDTDGIKTAAGGDYVIGDLGERVKGYLQGAADDTCRLAADRHKWLAFLPTVASAHSFAEHLRARGILTKVVTGETPKKEREAIIDCYRRGQVRCLITVLALATGFDVPDVDCLIWLRPTKSPVLYVQGVGRGMRIANGKTDCLWIDFTDTTERLGPVDAIKGHAKSKAHDGEAPYAICENCGEVVRPASLVFCPSCGDRMRDELVPPRATVSNAAILASQLDAKVVLHPVSQVTYRPHHKDGKPISIRVDYWDGLRVVASEWVCPLHGGFATTKAQKWIDHRTPDPSHRRFLCDPVTGGIHDVKDSSAGLNSIEDWIDQFAPQLLRPAQVLVDRTGPFPKVVQTLMAWETEESA